MNFGFSMSSGTNEVWLWVCLACYGLHMLEEFTFDWKDWAHTLLKLPVEWSQFYIVNAIVVVLGICAAQIGWRLPTVALMFPALMIINGLFFHVLPFIKFRKFSPGLFTAIILFFPVGFGTYYAAHLDKVLSVGVVVGSAIGGALLMAYPVVMLKLKDKNFFKQT